MRSPSVSDNPRAGLSVLWPDGPAVTPWRAGQKPPLHRLYKHCQSGLTNIYRPVRGDTVHPTEWKRQLDSVAWLETAPKRGCPSTGEGSHTSPKFSAAQECIAVISGSGSNNATTPEGDNTAESSSPKRTSDHQGEHRRKRVEYPTLQRPSPIQWHPRQLRST